MLRHKHVTVFMRKNTGKNREDEDHVLCRRGATLSACRQRIHRLMSNFDTKGATMGK